MPRERPFDADAVLRTDESQDPSTRYEASRATDSVQGNETAANDPGKPGRNPNYRQKDQLVTDEKEDPSQAVRDAYQDS